MVTTASRSTPPAGRGARLPDLVYALSFTTWSGAVQRGLCMPEDRLAAALTESDRVSRVLVANPYRSLPVKVARRLSGSRDEPFPEHGRARLHQPLRARRFDPTNTAAIERSCARYERSLRRAAAEFGIDRPAVLTTHPLLGAFGSFDWARSVTYYAWDDWAASEPHRRWWPAFEEAFARLRDSRRRVIAVSDRALERIAPTGPAAVVPNGIEPLEWLSPAQGPEWFLGLPRPRLLYVGTLDARLDVDQVARVAAAYPNGSVCLLGRVEDDGRLDAVRRLPNVEIRSPIGRAALTGVVRAADVCLLPHVRSPMTEAMSPLKLYEYLAAGRPVAAVDLPPIVGVSPRVMLAPTGGDILPAVAQALAAGPAPEDDRVRFVIENSWERRFEQILDIALFDELG